MAKVTSKTKAPAVEPTAEPNLIIRDQMRPNVTVMVFDDFALPSGGTFWRNLPQVLRVWEVGGEPVAPDAAYRFLYIVREGHTYADLDTLDALLFPSGYDGYDGKGVFPDTEHLVYGPAKVIFDAHPGDPVELTEPGAVVHGILASAVSVVGRMVGETITEARRVEAYFKDKRDKQTAAAQSGEGEQSNG